MTTNHEQAIQHLDTCLGQILEYAPDNEWIMHGNKSVSVAELKEFIAASKQKARVDQGVCTVCGGYGCNEAGEICEHCAGGGHEPTEHEQ